MESSATPKKRRRVLWNVWFKGEDFDVVVSAAEISGLRLADFIHQAILDAASSVLQDREADERSSSD